MEIFEANSIGEIIGIILLIGAIWFALTVFHLWLWKVIAVAIFNLPDLSLWQFVGLQILIENLIRPLDFSKIKFKAKEEK